MGQGPRASAGKDWAHEGCCGSILVARDTWEQSKIGAGQRDRQGSPCRHAGRESAPGYYNRVSLTNDRLVSLTMWKSALVAASRTACTTPSFYSKTLPTPFMGLPSGSGPELMRSVPRPFETSAGGPSRISMIHRTRRTGFLTACPFFPDILFIIF